MNPAHLHLLLNHVPILGAFFALPLLVLALWRRREPWSLAGAVLVLIVAAGGALGAYFTGGPAEEVVEPLAGVDEAAIEVHEERGEIATVLVVLTALGGLATAGVALRRGVTPVAPAVVVLTATAVTAGVMAWTGNAGGVIRHSEIREDRPLVQAPDEVGESASERAERTQPEEEPEGDEGRQD